MPNTTLFSGMNVNSTSLGVKIKGEGDKVDITHTDQDGHQTHAEIRFYLLSDLKKTMFFKSFESWVENLVNTWFTKRMGSKTIKYAGDNQLAFVFTPGIGFNKGLKNLATLFPGFLEIDYFKEIQFCAFLNNTLHVDLQTFRAMGISQEHVTLFLNNTTGFEKLLTLGISVTQAGSIPPAYLEFIFNHFPELEQLMPLGISSIPELQTIDLDNLKFLFSQFGALKQLLFLFHISIHELGAIKNDCLKFLFSHFALLKQLLNIPVSISELGLIPLDRLTLLFRRFSEFKKLLEIGMTPNQLATVDLDSLQKCIQKYDSIKPALRCVTLPQILNLDHTPLALDQAEVPNKPNYGWSAQSWVALCDNFSITQQTNLLKIIHTDPDSKHTAFFNLSVTLLDDASLWLCNKLRQNVVPISLVRQWHAIAKTVDAEQCITTFYCPSLKQLMLETVSPEFPLDEFKKHHYKIMLCDAPFYREMRFVAHLKESGYPLEKFMKLSGMSQQKLELLCDHDSIVSDLMRRGIKIEEFAKVEMARLVFVFGNPDSVAPALEFVDAHELLAIDKLTPRQAVGLFSQGGKAKLYIAPPAKEIKNTCVLM